MSPKNNKYIAILLFVLLALVAGNVMAVPQQKNVSDKVSPVPQKKSVPDLKQQLLTNPTKIPGLLKQGKLTTDKIPNPHWKNNGCTACHKKKSRAGRKNLRHRNIDKVCNTCHESLSAHNYIHVSNIKVPQSMRSRMPKQFRDTISRDGNKMTCNTCHDIPMTCKTKRHKEKGLNPMFFRGGPYDSRTGLCYLCHDEKKYQRVNAHDQINDKGELMKDKCLLCHTVNQDMSTANIIEDVEYNLRGNLSRLCWGCHLWKPHPGGSFTFFSGKGGTPNHLVKPSKSIRERMQKKQTENDIIFPLEPGTGKVFCGTCHNPHEKGVIKVRQAAKGADSKNRLRMQEICINCHDK